MAQPRDRIDDLQANAHADAQQANKESAVRQALGVLNPKNDDGQQGYPELLQRLKTAVETELAKVG